MPKVTQYAQIATTVLGEAVALWQLYEQLQPSTKTALTSYLSEIEKSGGEVLQSVAGFRTASIIGKVTAGFAVFGAIDDMIDTVENIYTQGAQLFAADWPQVQVHVANIETAVGLPVTPATVPAVPAAAAA